MKYEDAVKKEAVTHRRMYEYKCCICKKKRTTRKIVQARAMVCQSCRKARIDAEWEKRQQKLF